MFLVRIGIIKLSALGDIVVAMSFLPALKKKIDCEIDWFVDTRFEGILQDCPLVSNLYSFPLKGASFGSLQKSIAKARALKEYDLLIDMQGLIKSAILGCFIKTKTFRGFSFFSTKEKVASLFYNQKISIAYEENILKRNAKILGLERPCETREAFGYTLKAQNKISTLLSENKKYILLVLEASKPQKMYPISQYQEVCQAFKNQEIVFLLLWHTHFELAEQLHDNTQAKLLPKLSLDEVKALMDRVDLVIGGDTGVTHLAWAMQRPSITLYGNTPLSRFELRGDKNIALSGNANANYDKRDFSIQNISAERVILAIKEILR